MRSGDNGRLEFFGLTSVALRAPCVSPKNSKSVYDAPGTKCIGWIGTHRDSSRHFLATLHTHRERRHECPRHSYEGGDLSGPLPEHACVPEAIPSRLWIYAKAVRVLADWNLGEQVAIGSIERVDDVVITA